MEPKEIFELIIKADERLKYATDAKGAQRRQQARDLLVEARSEAVAIGNQPLIDQVDRRLLDIDTLPDGPAS
jgi:hypothetical protein